MKTTLKRRFLSILLALMMVVSLTSVGYAVGPDNGGGTASPMSGTETWNAGGGYVGAFTMAASNLTPVKTMGASGLLQVYGTAEANNNGNPWWIKVQLKDAFSGEVLAQSTSTPRTSSKQAYAVSLNVTKGQKIRVYMAYVTKPANNAYIQLAYLLST